MLLRWIVNNYLRDAAEGKVREVVAGVFNPEAGAKRTSGSNPSASPPRKPGERPGRSPISEEDSEGEVQSPESSNPQPAEIVPCDAVFIFGSGMEAGGLVDLLTGSEGSKHAHGIEHAGQLAGREIAIVESGVGAKASARAVAEAIKFYQPKWVIAAGFASALSSDLSRGHIVLADEVLNDKGARLPLGMKLDPQSLAKGVHVGRVLSVDDVVRHPDERRRLGEQHQAVACDMESFAIVQTCQQHDVRILAVRMITDAVYDELPPEIANLLAQKTLAAKIGATAGALLNRFSAAKDMWQLREDALKASDRLAKFLKSLLPQLPQ